MFEIIISLLLLALGFGSGSVENIRERLSAPFVSSEQVPENDIVEEFDEQMGAIVKVDGNDNQDNDNAPPQQKNDPDNVGSDNKIDKDKVSAYNEVSGKIVKRVAKVAIEKSPVLSPLSPIDEPKPTSSPTLSPIPTPTEIPKPIPSITPVPIPIITIPNLPNNPCPPIMVPPPGYKLELPERMPCMY